MEIHIKLYGDLKRFAPGSETEFNLRFPPGAGLPDLYDRLGIPGVLKFFLQTDQ